MERRVPIRSMIKVNNIAIRTDEKTSRFSSDNFLSVAIRSENSFRILVFMQYICYLVLKYKKSKCSDLEYVIILSLYSELNFSHKLMLFYKGTV